MNLKANSETRLLFLGDSITEGFDLSAFLPGLNAVNHGISGLSTGELLEAMRAEWFATQPDIVFLCIGTNDIARSIPFSLMLENTTRIVHNIRRQVPQANIFLTSLFPTLHNPPRPNYIIRQYNQLLHSLACDLEIRYLHLNPFFAGSDGRLLHRYTVDGLHFTEDAYRNWADLLHCLLPKK